MTPHICALLISMLALSARADDRRLMNLPPTDTSRIEITEPVWPAEIGDASICLWKDDKLAAVTITIDDNTVPDHEWWLETGKKYGVPFTWFVISGRVTEREDHFGPWQKFITLQEAGHDIQSHSFDHFNEAVSEASPLGTEENYTRAVTEIEAGVPGSHVLTFAYPGGPNAKNDDALAARHYVAARGVTGSLNELGKVNYMRVNSLSSVMNLEEENRVSLLNLVDSTKQRGRFFRGWGSIHFHGLEHPKNEPGATKAMIVAAIEYMQSVPAGFWIGTFTDVARYGQERDSAELASEVVGGQIKLTLSDRMNDDLFDVPLTVKVRINPAWQAIQGHQQGRAIEVERVEHQGSAYALVQVVPDRGEVVLTAGD